MSDIHGLGNVYYSMMNYLDNISKNDTIELYINGDMIDRGPDSAQVLLDIKKRIELNRYKIVYLGGNHELMMYQVFEKRKKYIPVGDDNDWYDNGGWVTDYGLDDILITDKEIFKVADFVSKLKIYHKFSEKINGKNIVLVHAAIPLTVKDECNLRISDDNDEVFYCVWTREYDPYMPFRCRVGHKNFFTIVGHTPNDNVYGYEYHRNQNYLNIDGGCAAYAKGFFAYDHIPLVEIKDNYLRILTFNNNNEIIYGNYFDGLRSIPLSLNELDDERKNLNQELKIRKLVRLPDNIIGYEDWIKD